MKRYGFKVTCDICGGPGDGDIETAAAAWNANREVVHSDPSDCREYLKRERRRLERVEAVRMERTIIGDPPCIIVTLEEAERIDYDTTLRAELNDALQRTGHRLGSANLLGGTTVAILPFDDSLRKGTVIQSDE